MCSLDVIAREGVRRGLCCRCHGRLVARLGSGFSNKQRGGVLRALAAEDVVGEELFLERLSVFSEVSSEEEDCSLCGGVFASLDSFRDLVVDSLSGWEFDTFLLGCRPDPEVVESEEVLWSEVGAVHQEPLKTELNREVGKLVADAIGKDVDFSRPDVVAVLDPLFLVVSVECNPVFFYGRYRKLERGIPQTRWPCRSCRGSGCERCSNTGKMYQTSVEEFVCIPLMEALEGEEHSFHGMGREDIDARMLGNGRPFVAEIKSPRKRKIDLEDAEKRINSLAQGRVEISGLRHSSKDEARKLKAAELDKSYLVGLKFQAPVSGEAVISLEASAPLDVQQRTPSRVSHRRSDMVRTKRVLSVSVSRVEDDVLELTINASSGTYIKEFCHGDDGRTKPSVVDIVGAPCSVLFLDVLDIHSLEE